MSKKMPMETKNVSVLARPKYYISEDEFYLRAREYLQKVFPGKIIPDGNNYVSVFMKQLEHDVTFWTENSKKSLSPEEIILLAITKRFYNCDVVCLSYVCQNSILNSDLIESLMFITSGFFSFEGWSIEA